MQKSIWLLIYLAIGLINLIGHYFEFDLLIIGSKPLLMPALIVHVAKNVDIGLRNLICSALIFAWLGDVFLLFGGYLDLSPFLFFILGLISFLFCHLLYIISFKKIYRIKLSVQFGFACAFILIILSFYLNFLWPNLDSILKIPVILYASIISVMLLFAVNLIISSRTISNVLIVSGALLFMASDMMIGISRFGGMSVDNIDIGIWIMFTYIVGQFLIVDGLRRTKF